MNTTKKKKMKRGA